MYYKINLSLILKARAFQLLFIECRRSHTVALVYIKLNHKQATMNQNGTCSNFDVESVSAPNLARLGVKYSNQTGDMIWTRLKLMKMFEILSLLCTTSSIKIRITNACGLCAEENSYSWKHDLWKHVFVCVFSPTQKSICMVKISNFWENQATDQDR